jgi:hypothetical protein
MEKKMKRDSREIELVKEIKEIESEVGRLEGERQKLADRINDLKKRKYKKDALLKKVVGESLLSGLEEVNVKDLSPQDRVELAKFIAEQIRMRTKDAGSGKGPDDQNSSERVDVSPDIGPESVSKGEIRAVIMVLLGRLLESSRIPSFYTLLCFANSSAWGRHVLESPSLS